jgi:hypothetical protein
VNPRRVVFLVPTLFTAAVMLWPAEAAAQHGGHGHGGTHVSVGVGVGFGYGHPIYASPYFYNPYWWGAYGGFYGGFYGYPYFGYPGYPPYGGFYDSSSDLRLQVTPRSAEVYIDGYLIGTVDDFDGTFQRAHMPPGQHDVTIYSPGYRSITQRMLFRPFESYKIKDTMQPLPAGETGDARPTPAPPRPRPDSRQNQFEPPMNPGQEFRAPAGPPPEPRNPDRIQVEPGADRFGTIAVRVQPLDAEILIDGERWEASGGERVLVHLGDGTHRVEVRKAGFVPYTSSVRIRTGETVTLNVSLTRQ